MDPMAHPTDLTDHLTAHLTDLTAHLTVDPITTGAITVRIMAGSPSNSATLTIMGTTTGALRGPITPTISRPTTTITAVESIFRNIL